MPFKILLKTIHGESKLFENQLKTKPHETPLHENNVRFISIGKHDRNNFSLGS